MCRLKTTQSLHVSILLQKWVLYSLCLSCIGRALIFKERHEDSISTHRTGIPCETLIGGSLECHLASLNTLVTFVGSYLISYFVEYLGGNITFPLEGYILVSIFFTAKLVETITTRQWFLGVDILGMNISAALTAMVYPKGLRLSSTARQSHTGGEIVNYSLRLLALAILYKNVGIASHSTLGATIVSILVTIPLAKVQEDYQDKLMSAKDGRMRKRFECLRNIRILKLQAW
ncbi:hypothetical protein AMTR_s00016p00070430 [Amborella trichopoda]|uniref:Uncharacterized protein n=1 Tax=Amborella trichopoda TaxID=13333 RepID=W1PEQ6_AMBTC|nr:hypothetical protein AMTR_s00016p00070430 [Amborella trichopoda]